MSNEPNSQENQSEEAMKARLAALTAALEKQKDPKPDQEALEATQRTGRAMSLGFRVLSEFVAGIIVGAVMGWQFDEWLGTKPVLLIVMTAFGTMAGFWNVYRIAAAPTGPQARDDKRSGS